MKKYKFKECDEVTSYAAHLYIRMPKRLFNDKMLHKFEDTNLYIHNGYDELLRLIYGDYMKIPDESHRQIHMDVNSLKFFNTTPS